MLLLLFTAVPAFAFERPFAESLAGDWDFVAVEPMRDIVPDRAAKPDFPQLSPEWFEVIDKSEQPPWDSDWQPVAVPGAWEDYAGLEYNGAGWYARFIDIPGEWLAADRRIFLEFDAVASAAGVWVANEFVGAHVGDYTRFRVEITGAVQRNLYPDLTIPPEGLSGVKAILMAVYVDELPGHVTQGFPSMIAPHHGGIWQDVRLYSTGPVAIAPDGIELSVDTTSGLVEATVSYDGTWDDAWPKPGFYITYYQQGAEELHDLYISHYDTSYKSRVDQDNRQVHLSMQVDNPELWSPATPNVYEAVVELPDMYDGDLTGPPSDLAVQRFAFREIEIDGTSLLLNGEHLYIRSGLQWGVYPGIIGPVPSPAQVRAEFAFIKDLGFNCETVCLVNMPDYFYDIADEMGMLIWQEYPTWHNDFSAVHLPTYEREFPAWFRRDRHHPAIILRSLSVEAGIADQDVVAGLYAMAKTMTDTPVQDNNSWFSHSTPETTDWYGEDNYLNCNQWARHLLKRLPAQLDEYPEKPYIIGESILFNTWPDVDGLLSAYEVCQEILEPEIVLRNNARLAGGYWPYWFPTCMDDCLRVSTALRQRYNAGLPEGQDIINDYLLPQSTAYSLNSRRFQIELLHADPRYAGYTVNVVRDMPLIRAGLIDDLGHPRWSAADWAWHNDTTASPVTVAELQAAGAVATGERHDPYEALREQAPALSAWREDWNGDIDRSAAVYYMADGYSDIKPLLKDYKNTYRVDAGQVAELGVPGNTPVLRPLITSVLTTGLVGYLERGGTVVLLTGKWPGALGSHHHFFWRDAFFAPPVGPFSGADGDRLTRLHPYDLTMTKSEVIPVDTLGLTDSVDPLIRLYDTHDLSTVVTFDAVFATRVGEGVLVASSLDHSTPAGQWVLGELCTWAAGWPGATPAGPLQFPVTRLMHERVAELAVARANMILPLSADWRFRTDAGQVGEEQEWMRPDVLSDGWDTIQCAASWESQGYSYDGMGWYRKWVEVPADWAGGRVKLVAEGIDDAYRVWVNGRDAGLHGSFTVHEETVWLNQTVTDLTDYIVPGQQNLIVLQVVDIVGQGGVYKPLYLAVE